jgi:hypothetical protein
MEDLVKIEKMAELARLRRRHQKKVFPKADTG